VPADNHLQLNEVLDYLKAKQDCAIIHPESKHEVAIEFDRKSNWFVQAGPLKDAPDSAVQNKLKQAKLKTKSREMSMHFGPNRGKTIQFFTVSGDFKSADAAARAALSMFDILWQVPATEWLWVTAMQYDDRDEPKRPEVWPPAGT
jgi:hypothetical protein